MMMGFLTLTVQAQVNVPKNAPQLEFALQLKVTLGEAYSAGETQHGRRTIIPITGGTFEGPLLKGTIINGGADYQLQNTALNRTELEAIYCIKTDDDIVIHVRTAVSLVAGRTPTASLRSTSGLHLSLRLLSTVSMPG